MLALGATPRAYASSMRLSMCILRAHYGVRLGAVELFVFVASFEFEFEHIDKITSFITKDSQYRIQDSGNRQKAKDR